MPSPENVETLAEIKTDLEGTGAMWVVDYRGLTVKEIQGLRSSIRDAGAYMKVYKNTLMHLALAETDSPNIDELLIGPSAFVFTGEDPAASAKVIRDFAKDNENLSIKGGLMDGEIVDVEQIKAIASLPSREQLYGQLAGLISGMARGLAVSINGVSSGLARCVSRVAEQKPAA